MKTLEDLIEDYINDADEWGLNPDSVEHFLYWLRQLGKDKAIITL